VSVRALQREHIIPLKGAEERVYRLDREEEHGSGDDDSGGDVQGRVRREGRWQRT
jgi:hypothetical protein